MATFALNYTTRPGTLPLTLNVLTGVVTNGFAGASTTLESELVNLVAGYVPGSYSAATDVFVITGTGVVDTITLGDGGGSIASGAGNDTLTGGAGDDTLSGGADNDTFVYGFGNVSAAESVDGGAGIDTLSFTASNFAIMTVDADFTSIERVTFADSSAALVQLRSSEVGDGLANNLAVTGSANPAALSFAMTAGDTLLDLSAFTFTNWTAFNDFSVISTLTQNETIIGASIDDHIFAGAGDDSISGGLGNDLLWGEAGNDTITGGSGDDSIDGGVGVDQLYGGIGNDTITAAGSGSTAQTIIYGGEGNDTITLTGVGAALINADSANSSTNSPPSFTNGNDFIDLSGLTSNSTYLIRVNADTLFGNPGGSDTIIGSGGADDLRGGLGADSIEGGDGNDYLYAGDGGTFETDNDTMSGGNGVDRINSWGGADVIDGGTSGTDIDELYFERSTVSADLTFLASASGTATVLGDGSTITGIERYTIYSGNGNDTITLLDGDDYINGGGGADSLNGGGGFDIIDGGTGNDTLDGGAGANKLFGGYGNDRLLISGWGHPGTTVQASGGDGDDTIIVQGTGFIEINGEGPNGYADSPPTLIQGADFIDLTGMGANASFVTSVSAGGGNDTVLGSDGIDTIYGDNGNDTLTGNGGADRFAYYGRDTVVQTDVVTDFSIAQGDRIELVVNSPASWEVLSNHLLRDISGTAQLRGIWNGNLQTMSLTGVTLASLGASQFVFDTSAAGRNITGTSGDDQLWGGLGDDTLTGGNGADFFAGDAGNDSMSGEAGTDRFDGGAGADTFNGGAGLDRVDYNVATTLILNAGGVAQAGSSTEALGDTFIGIEHIRGSSLADTIDVSSAVPILSGFGGNDTLTGGVSTNEINGGDGDDVINGGGANGAAMIGDVGGTRIYEQLNGDAGNDTINVQTLTGQIAYASGGAGNDTINGGAGNDQITGGADNDSITGGDGNDVINGGAGTDVLNGGNGNDTFTDDDGSASGDTYTGGAGADGIVYSTGNIFDFSAPGADSYDDTIDYIVFTNASTVTGTGGIDRFNGTGNNADHFFGLGGRDWLVGFGGNDTLEGGAENDRLDGGTGSDTLRGGTGSDNLTGGNAGTTGGDGATDTFVFNVTTDMTVRDAIFDFEVGATNDRIGLEGTSLTTGAWDTARFFTTGQTINISGPVVIYDQASGFVSYDADGNGAGSSTIFAVMLNHAAMTAANVTAM